MTDPSVTGRQVPAETEGRPSPFSVSGPRSPVPPKGVQAAASSVPPWAFESCPNCGAEVEPRQLACLTCGSRLGLGYRKPPSWRAPAAVVGSVLLLFAIGVGYGLREVSTDAEIESSREAAPEELASAATDPLAPGTSATLPSDPTPRDSDAGRPSPPKGKSRRSSSPRSPAPPPAPPSDSSPEPRAAAESEPKRGPKRNPRPTAPAIRSWPLGATGWTVSLAELPSRAEARAEARRAIRKGIPAGVLHSDDYASLEPGVWVVFAGRTARRARAERLRDRYAPKGYPDARTRFVEE